MNVTGIIAEYNPFHNGHQYQIEQIRKTGTDYIVVVMSGNFLQRGTPAILDKWTRTRMALLSGADLVIELPVVFSTASAQYFARGGVSILDKLGIVDTISFGCESNDKDFIYQTASFLWSEPDSYKKMLQKFLKEGNSFPKARELALTNILPQKETNNTNNPSSLEVNATLPDINDVASLVSSPNNILALEYVMALLERNSSMQILPIKRAGNGYHDKELVNNIHPSATAIRKILDDSASHLEDKRISISQETSQIFASNLIENSKLDQLTNYLPKSVFSIIREAAQMQSFVWQDDFSLLLKYKLLLNGNSSLQKYADITEDLSDKILKNMRHYQDYTQFCNLLKSKEITYSRINRTLTHILLTITQDMYNEVKENDYASYARILGFRKNAAPLLSEIGKKTSIPLISKLADASSILSKEALHYLEHDIFCAHVYESVIAQKMNIPMKNEFTRQIVITS